MSEDTVTEDIVTCFYCDTDQGPFVREHFLPRHLLAKRRARAVDYGEAWTKLVLQVEQKNIVIACKRCDQLKGGMHPRRWLSRCPPQGVERVRAKLAELGLEPPVAPKQESEPKPLGMSPPPWSKWVDVNGVRMLRNEAPGEPVKSLREHAAKYLEVKKNDKPN